jgi:hypothetical protein
MIMDYRRWMALDGVGTTGFIMDMFRLADDWRIYTMLEDRICYWDILLCSTVLGMLVVKYASLSHFVQAL